MHSQTQITRFGATKVVNHVCQIADHNGGSRAQNTCRRLCQVHVPLPAASRHPASR